jgi:hypothetical protein
MISSKLNDRLFLCFPAGFITGMIVGTTWAAFHRDNLQVEWVRSLLAGVTVSQLTTLLLTSIVVRKLFPASIETEGGK